MAPIKKITVVDISIAVSQEPDREDYICLTDMVKDKEGEDHIRNWMRNRNTIEFLGTWETINNPLFKGVEFDTFLHEAGANRFNMTPRKWIDSTNAIGIVSKAGRNGGTYAHKDIAFEFGSWISPTFKLYLIKEYQRLKEAENNPLRLEWDVKRVLSKVNYRIHTDAVKEYIAPKRKTGLEWLAYAEEADLLNVALWGYTAKEWAASNPTAVLQGYNLRDTASINELVVLSNLESFNAELIKRLVKKDDRFSMLRQMAQDQLMKLDQMSAEHTFRAIASSKTVKKLQ